MQRRSFSCRLQGCCALGHPASQIEHSEPGSQFAKHEISLFTVCILGCSINKWCKHCLLSGWRTVLSNLFHSFIKICFQKLPLACTCTAAQCLNAHLAALLVLNQTCGTNEATPSHREVMKRRGCFSNTAIWIVAGTRLKYWAQNSSSLNVLRTAEAFLQLRCKRHYGIKLLWHKTRTEPNHAVTGTNKQALDFTIKADHH